MRLHQARKTDFRRGKRLGPNDRLVVWNKPLQPTRNLTKEELKALPNTLRLRLVRYRIQIPGCRCQEVILVTTLLDAQLFSAAQLAQLYFRPLVSEARNSTRSSISSFRQCKRLHIIAETRNAPKG